MPQQLKLLFFTLLLQVNEVKVSTVSRKYGANKGMLQSLQQAASTFAGMVTKFCNRLGWLNLELLIGQFQDRFQFGIQVSKTVRSHMRCHILRNSVRKTS